MKLLPTFFRMVAKNEIKNIYQVKHINGFISNSCVLSFKFFLFSYHSQNKQNTFKNHLDSQIFCAYYFAIIFIPYILILFTGCCNYFVIINNSMAQENRFQNYSQKQEYTCYQSVLDCCGVGCGNMRAWCPCCCCWCPYPYKQVTQGYIGLIESFGRFQQEVGPGLHYVNPCTDKLEEVPLKTKVIDLDRQLILTKDNITVNIDTIVYYRIVDPKKASYRVANVRASVCEITYATLRTICGEHTLQDILEKRQQIADVIEQFVEEKVKDWGVYVEQIYIKDMVMSRELQTDLSMTAKTRRLAESKIISAQADVEAAKLMKESADILNSKAAMQIRYLDILQLMAKSEGNKLLFLPLSSHEFDDKK